MMDADHHNPRRIENTALEKQPLPRGRQLPPDYDWASSETPYSVPEAYALIGISTPWSHLVATCTEIASFPDKESSM